LHYDDIADFTVFDPAHQIDAWNPMGNNAMPGYALESGHQFEIRRLHG
jgi:hypothetical protein